MLAQEPGIESGSDYYLLTPSENAKEMLFYPTACGYFYTNSDYLVRRDQFHCYLILYLIEGQMSVMSGSKKEIVQAGQTVFLDCTKPHEYRSMGHAEFIWLHLDGANTDAFYRKTVQTKGGFVFSVRNGSDIRKQLYHFTYAMRNEQPGTEWQLSDRIYHLLILLLDESSDHSHTGADTASGPSKATRLAMDFIQQNYSRPLTLEQIAQAANMSQYHFSRIFKRDCGYSPHEYVMITRMNRAMFLLKTTDLPVKTISMQVGYQNETTFTNAFSNRIGLAPSRFRKFPF